MNIQKHFSATLKHQRLLRGMSMREFSEELGIALSSLEEYEAGRRIPRCDTIELIAEKLHIPPVSLLSRQPSADLSLEECLDYAASLIQNLHPTARVSAQHALDLLRCALQTSDELFFLEARSAPGDNPSERFRYILRESRTLPPSAPSYDILVKELRDGVWSASTVFSPVSNDRITALKIVFTANELQLPPSQFFSEVFPRFSSVP